VWLANKNKMDKDCSLQTQVHLGLVKILKHNTVLWLRVEHYDYRRLQLVLSKQSVIPNSQQQQ